MMRTNLVDGVGNGNGLKSEGEGSASTRIRARSEKARESYVGTNVVGNVLPRALGSGENDREGLLE